MAHGTGLYLGRGSGPGGFELILAAILLEGRFVFRQELNGRELDSEPRLQANRAIFAAFSEILDEELFQYVGGLYAPNLGIAALVATPSRLNLAVLDSTGFESVYITRMVCPNTRETETCKPG